MNKIDLDRFGFLMRDIQVLAEIRGDPFLGEGSIFELSRIYQLEYFGITAENPVFSALDERVIQRLDKGEKVDY